MRRYLIPFAVGLMLGIGTLPGWTSAHCPPPGPAHPPTVLTALPKS